MAIATLAAVHEFVFAYLHIRLKLPQTSRLQRSFLEPLEMRDRLWGIIRGPERQIGWPRGLSQSTLSGRRMPRLSRTRSRP
jgi:hypothetical protein